MYSNIVVAGFKIFFKKTIIVEHNPIQTNNIRIYRVDIEKKNRVKHPSPYKQKDQQCDDKFPFPPSGFVMIL